MATSVKSAGASAVAAPKALGTAAVAASQVQQKKNKIRPPAKNATAKLPAAKKQVKGSKAVKRSERGKAKKTNDTGRDAAAKLTKKPAKKGLSAQTTKKAKKDEKKKLKKPTLQSDKTRLGQTGSPPTNKLSDSIVLLLSNAAEKKQKKKGDKKVVTMKKVKTDKADQHGKTAGKQNLMTKKKLAAPGKDLSGSGRYASPVKTKADKAKKVRKEGKGRKDAATTAAQLHQTMEGNTRTVHRADPSVVATNNIQPRLAAPSLELPLVLLSPAPSMPCTPRSGKRGRQSNLSTISFRSSGRKTPTPATPSSTSAMKNGCYYQTSCYHEGGRFGSTSTDQDYCMPTTDSEFFTALSQ